MGNMKILQLITGLPIGGAEKVLLDLCRHLDSDMIDSYVVGLNHEDTMNWEFEKAGIFVKNLNMKRDIKGMFKSLYELNALVVEEKIEIIHTHMFHPLIFAYLLKLRHPKLKIVFTSHSENIGSNLREKITKFLKFFRDADVIFSKHMHTDIYKKDAYVIPNGVDIEKFSQKLEKNSKFTFIAVGVLRKGKNHVSLVENAKKLKSLGYEFEVHIVGSGDASGDEKENIENAIEKANVKDVLKMLGSCDDIASLLSKADCFVMPSLYEGLPISLLEAGAAGLPVISTPVGAISSVIDEHCGYLATLDKFGDKMEYVLNHKQEARKMGENLRNLISEKYSIKSMTHAHEDIYKNILKKRG